MLNVRRGAFFYSVGLKTHNLEFEQEWATKTKNKRLHMCILMCGPRAHLDICTELHSSQLSGCVPSLESYRRLRLVG